MFLSLAHKSLHVCAATRELVKIVYTITKLLPAEEKFNMMLQLRKAALSVKLNWPKEPRVGQEQKETAL